MAALVFDPNTYDKMVVDLTLLASILHIVYQITHCHHRLEQGTSHRHGYLFLSEGNNVR